VFPHRYHARALRTPREVRNALAYVLLNHAHHEHEAAERRQPAGATAPRRAARIDPRSSGPRFTGWREPVGPRDATTDLGTVPARTWLLRVGWKRHGLLGLDEIPGVGPPRSDT